ncbi:MAG: uL15m family ribosomal protein, partial [Candidatus Kuenenbacteria bacterium]
KDDDIITPESLFKKGLVDKIKNGVKILGDGELKKKLIIKDCAISKSAKEKIEKIGGKVFVISAPIFMGVNYDARESRENHPSLVIPAKAGIQGKSPC